MIINIPINKYQSALIELTELTDNTLLVKFKYNPTLVAEIKSMDGASFNDSDKSWTIKNNERNWYNFSLLGNGNSNPRYDSSLTNYQDKIRATNPVVMNHQIMMINHGLTRRRCHIAGDPGTGKTLAVILLMELVQRSELKGLFWIVAPKTAIPVWRSEFRKWHSPLVETEDYRLMTYDRIGQLIVNGSPLPSHLICDEAHKLKNPQAQRSENLKVIGHHIRSLNNDTIIILMTGTPSPNDPSDWWNQIELIQPGFLRESTKAKFSKRLGIHETRINLAGQQYQELIEWDNSELKILKQRLKGMVLPIFKKDCLDLPPKTYIEYQLPISKKEMSSLRLIAEMSGRAAQTFNTLRQLSDGFKYQPDGSAETITTPKDEKLIDILDELKAANINRVVIFAGFHASIDKLINLVQNNGWHYIKLDGRGTNTDLNFKNNVIEECFQNKDDLRNIAYIGHPESGGISITLTAAETMIFYSNSPKGDVRLQAEDRCHRIGTTKINIIDLLWLPIDKYCLELVRDKKDLQSVTTGEIDEYIDKFDYSYLTLKEGEQ